jgi:hypothetical protein
MQPTRCGPASVTRSELRAAFVAVGLAATLSTCDPVKKASFGVTPGTAGGRDSSAEAAFGTIARVAGRYGLREVDPADAAGKNEQGWLRCFTVDTVFVCAKRRGPEVQVEMRQRLAGRFSPWADSLRRELVDSLRAPVGSR